MKKSKNSDNKDDDNMKNKKKNSSNDQPTEPSAELDKILKAALNNYLMSQASAATSRTKDLDALKITIEEFLNCFIVIGYLPTGEPVNIISAHNQQEADSLSALLNKFLLSQSGDIDKDF
jgi:hypothetical protein